MNSAEEILQHFLNKKDEGSGRGKKLCPECQSYVGARTHECDCGHRFVKGETQQEQKAKEDQPTDEERLYSMCTGMSGRIVYAAAGSPPTQLHEVTQDAVNDYCNIIVSQGIIDKKIYTVTAIKHWLIHQLGYNTKEYREAAKFVDLWRDEKIGVDTPSG